MSVRQTSSTPSQVTHDGSFSVLNRGIQLQRELDQIVQGLSEILPDRNFSIVDRHNIVVRTHSGSYLDDTSIPRWDYPIVHREHTFGFLRIAGSIDTITQQDALKLLLLRTALVLTELMEWAETESERRGEKVQRIMQQGMTVENFRLLDLCGLSHAGDFVLVSMEMASEENRFQYMEVLRRFMLSHIWRYNKKFDFLAFRPNGLTGIFSGHESDYWRACLQLHLKSWKEHYPNWDVRLYITDLNGLGHLDHALKEVDMLMATAARWNMSGLIETRLINKINQLFANVSFQALSQFVVDVLGPLLHANNRVLIDTLRVYLRCGNSAAKTASALYIHRNTLQYRFRQIEEILAIQLRKSEDMHTVWIAVQAVDLLDAAGLFSEVSDDQ